MTGPKVVPLDETVATAAALRDWLATAAVRIAFTAAQVEVLMTDLRDLTRQANDVAERLDALLTALSGDDHP